MSEQNQLVFYGEILPGHEADAVKAKLGELLKLPNEQIAGVFSGRRIVLRKSLPDEQAASYVARLEKIGVKVFAEPIPVAVETVAAPVLVPTQPLDSPVEKTPVLAAPAEVAAAIVETPVAPPAQLQVVEEMDCPKCGERQPKRTLCRACSVDMKRYVEAQQEAENTEREERLLAREIAMIERGRGPRVSTGDEEEARILGLGFSGRIGRINYWVGGLPCLTLLMLTLWLGFKTQMAVPVVIGIVATLFLAVRLTVLRCHDINWSGWFSLILLIPYVGSAFGLLLSFIPGTKGDNSYGSPARMVGVPVALVMLLVCVVSAAMSFKEAESMVQSYLMAGGSKAGSGQKSASVQTLAEADVEMFTTSDCGVCHAAKRYMNKRGIQYVEKDVEKNEDYLRDFYARGGRAVPYIFVGEQSMMGFDADWLERALASRR